MVRHPSPQIAAALADQRVPPVYRLPAGPDSCYWGYLDRNEPAALTVPSGAIIDIEGVTHHSGDAPDLMMDDGIRSIWDAIDPADRTPGVHIMTGPIHIEGATPGHTLLVRVLAMTPRHRYGSNCAANWGLLYDRLARNASRSISSTATTATTATTAATTMASAPQPRRSMDSTSLSEPSTTSRV